MAKAGNRVKVTLECTECKERNYITMKSKVNDRERLEMSCAKAQKQVINSGNIPGDF